MVERATGSRVFNAGVPGYGTDQAYLRYRERKESLAPDIVILGLMIGDMKRNVNVFRTFLAGWTAWAALAVAVAALVPLMQVRLRDAGWVAAACALSYGGARGGALLLGPELGAFAGSLLLGMAANAFARWRSRPASLLLTPGILLLVPGSVGFLSLHALLEQDVVGGFQTAFQAGLEIDRNEFGVGTGSWAATMVVGGGVSIDIAVEANRH